MESKKFLFVSIIGLCLDMAWQVQNEGHKVKLFIDDDDDGIGDGFFEKVKNWKAEVDWADVIVFDDVEGQGAYAERLRAQGKLVFGGSAYTDRLEDDRSFGQEELKKHDIPTLSYGTFTDFDEAIQYVTDNPGAYVLKPSGQAQNYKGLLFVGQEEDGTDIIRMLETYKRAWSNKIKIFQLQKKVSGVEVAVGAFFNGTHFITPINVNFEHKKLFPGEVGPPTGEMGTSMFWSPPNKLFNATLKKFETRLAEEHYVGYIDLNCIVNGYGIYPLEFTARIGYPTIHIQQEGIQMPTGELIWNLVTGVDFEIKTRKGFQVGVLVVAPPFPYEDKRLYEVTSKDSVIVFKKKHNGDGVQGVHIGDIKLVNDEWVLAGYAGIAAIVVGCGQTMRQAQQQAYSRIQNILLPNMYYRTDIGDRWVEDSDKLHNWGYLREV
jgi:phosphoribosylamine--glycine ligase